MYTIAKLALKTLRQILGEDDHEVPPNEAVMCLAILDVYLTGKCQVDSQVSAILDAVTRGGVFVYYCGDGGDTCLALGQGDARLVTTGSTDAYRNRLWEAIQ